jgi:transposase InsO family protein
MHAKFFFADNAVNFQHCLRKAITKYGVPKRLYVDNGSPYKNEQLRLICAGLGIILIHSRVRQPQGKGKQIGFSGPSSRAGFMVRILAVLHPGTTQ